MFVRARRPDNVKETDLAQKASRIVALVTRIDLLASVWHNSHSHTHCDNECFGRFDTVKLAVNKRLSPAVAGERKECVRCWHFELGASAATLGQQQQHLLPDYLVSCFVYAD